MIDRSKGLNTPLSFIPNNRLNYVDELTFMQRTYNVLFSTYEDMLRRLSYIPAQNKLARKYFSDGLSSDIPNVGKITKEHPIVLVNSHTSVEKPRPRMPGEINVGGAHIRPALRLPADLFVSFISKSFIKSSVKSSYAFV